MQPCIVQRCFRAASKEKTLARLAKPGPVPISVCRVEQQKRHQVRFSASWLSSILFFFLVTFDLCCDLQWVFVSEDVCWKTVAEERCLVCWKWRVAIVSPHLLACLAEHYARCFVGTALLHYVSHSAAVTCKKAGVSEFLNFEPMSPAKCVNLFCCVRLTSWIPLYMLCCRK